VNADDAETPGTETGETRRDATRLYCFCEQTNLTCFLTSPTFGTFGRLHTYT
jgi:hypothetical protein